MSTTPAPALVIDCTVVELEPAVYDATGVCIKPPVLALPQEYDVPLDGDYAINAAGQMVSLTELAIEPPETLDEWNQRQTDAAEAVQVAAATATGAAWVNLRMIRDRWLAQTDYLEVFLTSGFTPLPQPIQDAVTANRDGWLGWRQALRDLPAQVAVAGTPSYDPVGTVAGAARIHSTADVFPAPWPQPPAAPVIHLT